MKTQSLLAQQDIQFYDVFIREAGIGGLKDKSLMHKGILLAKWGNYHQGYTWFLKGAQVTYFTTFYLYSDWNSACAYEWKDNFVAFVD